MREGDMAMRPPQVPILNQILFELIDFPLVVPTYIIDSLLYTLNQKLTEWELF